MKIVFTPAEKKKLVNLAREYNLDVRSLQQCYFDSVENSYESELRKLCQFVADLREKEQING